jgi:hypothetical protein
MKTIEIETQAYNERRYSRPYIAIVDFSVKKTGEVVRWGDWIGHAGDAGILSIEAAPGDIVMTGQKDFRKPRNSAPDYHMVLEDGTLGRRMDKAEAYRHSRTTTENPDKETP